MASMNLIVLLLLLLLHTITTFMIRKVKYQLPFTKNQQKDTSTEQPEWGVSFIGQDVCGSKYNNDPFSEIDKKPDAFELFQKKLNAIEERINNNKTLTNKNSGKWP